MVQKLEERLLQKIKAQLADIPGVLASVTVELDTSKRVKMTNLHDAPQPRTESQQTSEQTSVEAPTEPGVIANVGQAVTSVTGGSRHATEETQTENFEPKLRETETVEQGPTMKKVTAAVGIPRSFIVGVFRANHPGAPEPTDDEPKFTMLRDEHMARVKAGVEKIVMAKSPNDVQVDVYPDVEWGEKGPGWASLPGAVASSQGGVPSEYLDLLTGYGPQAGMALLAMLSLFMVLRVVKGSSETLSAKMSPKRLEIPPADEPVLAVESAPIGQAAPTDAFLVGREVDDESLRSVELTKEVAKMVEEDPQGAAELLRRWLNGH